MIIISIQLTSLNTLFYLALTTIITIFKDSSYLSTIGVVDFMYQGRRLMAHFFKQITLCLSLFIWQEFTLLLTLVYR